MRIPEPEYIPLTDCEIIEDARYNAHFADSFRDELSDEAIAVILHYLLRKKPDYLGAGMALRTYIGPVMGKVIEHIKHEHLLANTGIYQ